MPRYHLHVRSGPEEYLDYDPDGMTLPNLGSAHALALKMAQELWADWPQPHHGTIIEVANGDGETLLIVPLLEAIGPKQ